MTWQDSFTPDQTAPKAVQANGWQNSFVPDSYTQQPESDAISQGSHATGYQSDSTPNSLGGRVSSVQDGQNNQESNGRQNTSPDPNVDLPLYMQAARQAGLLGRDFLNAAMVLPNSIGDLANEGINSAASGINNVAGTHISPLGMPSQTYNALLTNAGLPNPATPTEQKLSNAHQLLLGITASGEPLVNQAKEVTGNLANILKGSSKAETSTGQITSGVLSADHPTLTPKNSDLKLISSKLALAGVSPQEYATALKNSSPDMFAAEVGGDPLRIQSQTYAKLQGPTMQAARDAMRQRLAEAPQRVQSIIDTNATPQPLIERMQDNISSLRDQLPDLYQSAYKESVPSSVIGGQLATPAGKNALQETAVKLANKGVSPEDAGFFKNDRGLYSLNQNVPIETLHEFSKSLGDQVVRNPLTGAIEDSNSLAIEGQRKGITTALSKVSPAFAKANNTAAAVEQAQSAFDAGRKIAHSAAGDAADQLLDRAAQTYSPNELAYHRAGYSQGLMDKTSGAALGTGSPAARIANGNVINKTAEIYNSPSQAKALSDALMAEKQMTEFANRGLNNSTTAEAASAALPEIPTSAHGIALSAASKIGEMLNHGTNERMSQLLFTTSPAQKKILADALIKYNGRK